MTNLKKGCALAKSSECLLSPEASFTASSSSLDRYVSQPNVAVPVPVPRLDIPESDPFPNVAHVLQLPDGRETENNGNALLSVESALTKVNASLGYLDVVIPVSANAPSPVGSSEYNATRVKVMLPTTGVRKSTSFRDPSPSRPAGGSVAEKNSNLESNVDAVNLDSGDKRNSKSNTLPRSGMPGMSGFDPDLLEEINTFSTIPRCSSPAEVPKKAAPARPRPPTKKPVESNKTASPSNTAMAPGSAKAGPTVSTPSGETTSRK